MRTNSFFDQQRAREVDVGPLRSGTSTREAPASARQPAFEGLTIGLHWGDHSFRAGPVRERMVAHPRRGTAERLHTIRYRSRKLELTLHQVRRIRILVSSQFLWRRPCREVFP
jgi:hypothetical protein